MTTDKGVNIAASHAQETTALKQWRESVRERDRERETEMWLKKKLTIFVHGKQHVI